MHHTEIKKKKKKNPNKTFNEQLAFILTSYILMEHMRITQHPLYIMKFYAAPIISHAY